jgi:uracil-DNA glycosylase family 4
MIKGFFTQKETGYQPRVKGRVLSCASCGLYKGVTTPKMKPFGNFKKEILCIGEAPGQVEDRKGIQWQGRTGTLLKNTLTELGIDLFEDCLNVNAVNCRPDKNQTPTNFQIDCCRHVMVQGIIEEYQPKVIIPLGKAALYSILGNQPMKNFGGIMKWRGWTIPDRQFKAWICPTLHPSYIYREENNKAIQVIWKEDLQQAINKISKPLPRYNKPDIEIIDDLNLLSNIKTDLIAFDYETTAIKPHANGHRIVCASVADTENHAYVFMMPEEREQQLPFLKMLRNRAIGKMAHNIKFEDNWTNVVLHTSINNWIWDSMIAAHILDNRTGITGLKFQTYVNFGIADYSSEVDSYLTNTVEDKGGNSQNRIEELIKTTEGQGKLLNYCALDSIYEYRLAQVQMKKIDYDFLPF